MSDPSYNLQKAVFEALSGIASGKVFHTVPDQTALPYLQIGEDHIESDNTSGRWSRCTVVVNVFASTVPQVKALAGEVRDALELDLIVEGFATAESFFISTHYVRDKNGMTAQAVCMFEYLLIPLGE